MDIAIPANTTATVIIPACDSESTLESGEMAGHAEGVKLLQSANGHMYCSVLSGTYHFVSNSDKKASGDS